MPFGEKKCIMFVCFFGGLVFFFKFFFFFWGGAGCERVFSRLW